MSSIEDAIRAGWTRFGGREPLRWFVRDELAVDDLLGAIFDRAGAPDADAVRNAIGQELHAIGAAARAVLDAVARPQIPMIVRAGI